MPAKHIVQVSQLGMGDALKAGGAFVFVLVACLVYRSGVKESTDPRHEVGRILAIIIPVVIGAIFLFFLAYAVVNSK